MHLALRVDEIQDFIIDEYIKHLFSFFKNTGKFMVCRELKKNSNTPHYHLYLEVLDDIKVKFKTLAKKLNVHIKQLFKLKPTQHTVQEVNDVNRYIPYMLKDGDPTHHNIPPEELEQHVETMQEIKDEMEMPRYKKIYKKLQDKKINNTSDYVREIHKLYIEDWNKAPPQRHTIITSLQYHLYMEGHHNQIDDLLNIPDIQFENPAKQLFKQAEFIDDSDED